MNWISFAEIIDLVWIGLAGTAGFKFISAIKGINGTVKTFAQAAKKQDRFWKYLSASIFLYLPIAFGLKIYFRHETPLAVNEIISAVQEPKFSCDLVEKRGQIWHINGPVTIGRTVFKDVDLTPHSFKTGNIDVYTFLDIKCSQ